MVDEKYIYEWDIEILEGKKIVVKTNEDNWKEAIAKAQKISDEYTTSKGLPRRFAIFPQYSVRRKVKVE